VASVTRVSREETGGIGEINPKSTRLTKLGATLKATPISISRAASSATSVLVVVGSAATTRMPGTTSVISILLAH